MFNAPPSQKLLPVQIQRDLTRDELKDSYRSSKPGLRTVFSVSVSKSTREHACLR